MIDGPVYGSAFLGAGADWLCLLDPALVPLVSWMGGKRRLAPEILALLELRPGRPVPAILGDASWWGWLWPVVLDPVEGPRVSEVLRSWRGEDPRALWFRLRDLGPVTDDVAVAAAQLLWLQARAASGVPVWWEGEYSWARDGASVWRCSASTGVLLAAPGDGRERQVAYERGLVQDRGWKSATKATRTEFPATQAHAGERLIATTRGRQAPGAPYDAAPKSGLIQMANGRGPYKASMSGQKALVQWAEDGLTRPNSGKGFNAAGAGGIVDPGTIADRADRIRAAAIGDVAIHHVGARELTEEWAPRLGARGRWYYDPPYAGATGYPATCPREEVLAIVETAARSGGMVVVSEAVRLDTELGRGWSAVQLRGGAKPEWVTCWGCDVRAVLPPLLRMGAA